MIIYLNSVISVIKVWKREYEKKKKTMKFLTFYNFWFLLGKEGNLSKI